jgi:hypothetical protein
MHNVTRPKEMAKKRVCHFFGLEKETDAGGLSAHRRRFFPPYKIFITLKVVQNSCKV